MMRGFGGGDSLKRSWRVVPARRDPASVGTVTRPPGKKKGRFGVKRGRAASGGLVRRISVRVTKERRASEGSAG